MALQPPFEIERATGFAAALSILLNGAPLNCSGLTAKLAIFDRPRGNLRSLLTTAAPTDYGSGLAWTDAAGGLGIIDLKPEEAADEELFPAIDIPPFTRSYSGVFLLLDGLGAPVIRKPAIFPFKFLEAGVASTAEEDGEISIAIREIDITLALSTSTVLQLGLIPAMAEPAAPPSGCALFTDIGGDGALKAKFANGNLREVVFP